MARTLLFLTNRFPYGTGESFIESEVPYLSKGFGKVLIFPVEGKLPGPVRPLPSNVSVIGGMDAGPNGFPVRKKMKWAASMFFAFLSDLANGSYEGRFSPKALKRAFHNAVISGRVSEVVKEQMSTGDVDAVYSFWSNFGAAGAVQAIRSMKKKVPFICRAHGYDLFWERQDPPFVVFQGFIIGGSDLYLADSRNGEKYLKKKYPDLVGRISARYLGTRLIGTSSPSGDGVFRIVSVSSLIPLKRVDLIPKALMEVGGKVEWVHFGDGPDRPKVESLVDRLKGKRKAISVCLKGNVPNREVLEHYRSKPVDLFLHVSEYEGLPVSIMEALSFSVPVVAADSGGIRELVGGRSGCGRLLPHDPSPSEIAKAVSTFMGMDRLGYISERDRSFRVWQEYVDADRNFKAFTDEVKELVEGRPKSR